MQNPSKAKLDTAKKLDTAGDFIKVDTIYDSVDFAPDSTESPEDSGMVLHDTLTKSDLPRADSGLARRDSGSVRHDSGVAYPDTGIVHAKDSTNHPPVTPPAPPIIPTWKPAMFAILKMDEVSYKNWVQTNTDYLDFTGQVNGSLTELGNGGMLYTDWILKYGGTRLSGQRLHLLQNDILVESTLRNAKDTIFSPSVYASIETYISPSYIYDYYDNPTEIAKPFDPATLYQRICLTYFALPPIITLVAGGFDKEIITREFTDWATDPSNPNLVQRFFFSSGVSFEIDVNWTFMKNLTFKTQTIFDVPIQRGSSIAYIDYISNSEIDGVVNQNVLVMLTLQLRKQLAESPLLQIRQGITLGVTYSFF